MTRINQQAITSSLGPMGERVASRADEDPVQLPPIVEEVVEEKEDSEKVNVPVVESIPGQIVPGTYNSALDSFLDTTSTRIAQLQSSDTRGEWAVVIANRNGSLEFWALRPQDSDNVVWVTSQRNGLLVCVGSVLGASVMFIYLAYL